jgi:hypothetical protein
LNPTPAGNRAIDRTQKTEFCSIQLLLVTHLFAVIECRLWNYFRIVSVVSGKLDIIDSAVAQYSDRKTLLDYPHDNPQQQNNLERRNFIPQKRREKTAQVLLKRLLFFACCSTARL